MRSYAWLPTAAVHVNLALESRIEIFLAKSPMLASVDRTDAVAFGASVIEQTRNTADLVSGASTG